MGPFELLWMVIVGLVVGVVAKVLLPGKDPGGFIVTALIGIAGSLVGTFVGRNLLHMGRHYSAGFLMSVAGAILLLVLYRVIAGRRE